MQIPYNGGWNLNECGLGSFEKCLRPESEWGNPPELKDATQSFCEKYKLNFLVISTDDYNLPGILGTYAFQRKFEKSNLSPRGVALEIYTATFYSAIPRTRYLPLWVVFPPIGSYKYASKFLERLYSEFPDLPRHTALTTIPAGYAEQKYHFSDSITFKQWKSLLLKYSDSPANLRIIHYKGDEITYSPLKIIMVYPKLYSEAWNWGQEYALESFVSLTTEDLKWAAQKAELDTQER